MYGKWMKYKNKGKPKLPNVQGEVRKSHGPERKSGEYGELTLLRDSHS